MANNIKSKVKLKKNGVHLIPNKCDEANSATNATNATNAQHLVNKSETFGVINQSNVIASWYGTDYSWVATQDCWVRIGGESGAIDGRTLEMNNGDQILVPLKKGQRISGRAYGYNIAFGIKY